MKVGVGYRRRMASTKTKAPAKGTAAVKAKAKAKAASAKPTSAAPTKAKGAMSFDALLAMLGKRHDDPDVVSMIAALGAKKDSDYIVAKDHGVDFALDHKTGEKKKVLSAIFLHPPRVKPTRPGFDGLPAPFTFSSRAEIRALAAPDAAWTMDDGDVPPTHPESERDTWHRDGYDISAEYRSDGSITHYYVEATGDAAGSEPLHIDPLHFATKPVDGPDEAVLVAPALVLAWATTRIGPSKKHAKAAEQLAKRTITPVQFYKSACNAELGTQDFDPKLHTFLHGYLHQTFTGTRAPNREATAKTIATLWGLEDDDERYWDDDYKAAFRGVVKSLYYVPDSWAAVDRLGALMDARWADFEATGFKKAPDLALYKKAAKARDAIAITPTTKAAAVPTTDASLTKDLLALVGTPLKDPAIKPVFARAGLPIGKKIDEQANPALGIVYMGSNTKRDGKTVLIVEYVQFKRAGQKSYVRGLGKEVEFATYPHPLPGGFSIGASRADVINAYGEPAASDTYDRWFPSKDKRILAKFEKGRLVTIHFGLATEWGQPPKPPYTPEGLW